MVDQSNDPLDSVNTDTNKTSNCAKGKCIHYTLL